MHRSCSIVALAASGLFAFASSASAHTTRTVCASGCDFTSINAAIGASSNGDVIQLSAETYSEGKQIDTDGKAITLRGVLDKAGEPASVLDGVGGHRILVCQNGETSTTAFRDLVIRNGYAHGHTPGRSMGDAGGGMYNCQSSPTLSNCTFTDNSATDSHGGGMYNDSSSLTLANCTFTSNSADNYGRGMYNFESSPTLTDCNFCGNTNTSSGAFENIVGDINESSSGNQLLEHCVVGDIDFDDDFDADDAQAAMKAFGITEGTPGDMDGDDDVDAADFVAVRDQVGVEALGCLVADIDGDGDGEVNGSDLSYVLGYWGLCSAP